MAIAVQMDYKVDLCKPVHLIQMDVPFFVGDQNAHRFHVKLLRNDCDVDVGGMTARGYMVRADKQTVIWDGEVDGCDIYLTMPASCYVVPGCFRLLLRVSHGDTIETALWVEGCIKESTTDVVVDPGAILPSLNELLEQIARIESAVERAENVCRVYVGSDQPPVDADVWIDPEGEASLDEILPKGEANQTIVTDQNGVAHWEDLTHYDHSGGTVLQETDLKVVGGYTTFTAPFENMPIVGTPYKVKYLSYDYECTAKAVTEDGRECVIIGNQSHLGSGENTQEPFIILFYPPETVNDGLYGWFSCLATDKSTVHLGIVGNGELKKIDKKFLPDNIGGMPEGGAPFQQLVTDGEGNTVWADRLAYEDPNAVTEILPETELSFIGDAFAYFEPLETTLAAGETYTVTYNGQRYDSTAVLLPAEAGVPGAAGLGNVELMGGTGGADMPFVLVVVPESFVAVVGAGMMCIPLDGATSVTISIAKAGGIHRIPLKFLPEYMYGVVQSDRAEVLSERTVSANATATIDEPFTTPLVEGCEYTVILNGTEYKSTAKLADDGVEIYIGAYKGATDDPYFVRYLPPEKAAIYGVYGYVYNGLDEEASIEVFGPGESIRKVPEKFLPAIGGALTITADYDMTNVTISNISHTYEQAREAFLAGKEVRMLLKGRLNESTNYYALPAIILTEDDAGTNKMMSFQLAISAFSQSIIVMYNGLTGEAEVSSIV